MPGNELAALLPFEGPTLLEKVRTVLTNENPGAVATLVASPGGSQESR